MNRGSSTQRGPSGTPDLLLPPNEQLCRGGVRIRRRYSKCHCRCRSRCVYGTDVYAAMDHGRLHHDTRHVTVHRVRHLQPKSGIEIGFVAAHHYTLTDPQPAGRRRPAVDRKCPIHTRRPGGRRNMPSLVHT
jgi:hypothetical protein